MPATATVPTLVVERELYQRMEEAAPEHNTTVGELFAEAVRRYLWELDRRKISAESQIYQQQYPELKNQHLGQYIAMRNGQVVDRDTDFLALRQRICQRLGRVPVMITRVEDVPERLLARRGFRLGAGL